MLHYVTDSYAKFRSSGGGLAIVDLRIPSNHNRIALVSASIPKTFYLIDAQSCAFQMTFSVAGTQTFILPIGTYRISDLVSELNACSSLASITMASLGTWAYDSIKSILVFSQSGSQAAANAFVDIRFYNRLGRIMGWDYGVANPAVIQQGYYRSTSATSETCVNLTVSNALWLTCDIARDQSQSTFTSAISSLYVNDRPAQAYIVYQNPDPESTAKTLTTFEAETLNDYVPQIRTVGVAFKFLYDDGSIASFNGVHWNIVVRTWREEPSYELFRRFVNMQIEWIKEQRLYLSAKNSI